MGWASADEEDEPHISYGTAVWGKEGKTDQQVVWHDVLDSQRDDEKRQGLPRAVFTLAQLRGRKA
eukprot:1362565-Pyramimonas_sp.AAC.1